MEHLRPSLDDRMAPTYSVDIAVGTIACCVSPLVILQRWHQQIPWELAMHAVCFMCFLSMVILPWRCQGLYHRHRTTIVLSVKAVSVLMPIVRSQVRLNQPATGYWLRDFMNASIGARLWAGVPQFACVTSRQVMESRTSHAFLRDSAVAPCLAYITHGSSVWCRTCSCTYACQLHQLTCSHATTLSLVRFWRGRRRAKHPSP